MRDGGRGKINRSDKQRKGFIILNELSVSFLQGMMACLSWPASTIYHQFLANVNIADSGLKIQRRYVTRCGRTAITAA